MKMHPFGFFPPLISLACIHVGIKRFAFSSQIVLAMTFDGSFAIQQIHQEEQALEIKKQL